MALKDLQPLISKTVRARTTLAATVEAVLREAILNGLLQDGEELNQVKLAEQFGISRIPVREALLRLETEGLVTSLPYRRTVVASLRADVLVDIFDVRRILEVRALELAIENVDEATLAEMERLVKAMDRLSDQTRWFKANHTFHSTLYKASKRDVLCAQIEQLRTRSQRYFTRWRDFTRQRQANAEHLNILEAVRARDLPRAKDCLERHLEGTLASVLSALQNPPPDTVHVAAVRNTRE